jgi:hypothetical protein
LTASAIWRVVKPYLSWRTLFDALWMDEPLYVISMMYFHPFDWSLFAVCVWLLGTLAMFKQSCMKIAWSFGARTRPGTSNSTGPLTLNRSWTRFTGRSDVKIASTPPLVITPKGIYVFGSNAPVRSGRWRTRWRQKLRVHWAKVQHAAWIAQNIFD